MKPVYLEFCGINSFSEKAEIDFRALISGGVFGVFGATGSGKSTILDCIHLALYGKIERSSGNDYLNYNVENAYVIFDFEVSVEGVTRTYRVHRERRRKSNTAKASLFEYSADGKLLALAEGMRDVDAKIEEILGLEFADFKMCIALPQGDFAALVKAPASERLRLVARLFDLEKYGERLSKKVNEKYYEAEEECNLVLAKMGENAGASAEDLEAKSAEIAENGKLLSEAEKKYAAAENEYRDLLTLQKEKAEYEALKKQLEELTQRLPQMEKRRAEIEKLPFARAVVKEADALEKNRKDTADAKRCFERAAEEYKNAEKICAAWKEKQNGADFDGQILDLSVKVDKVRGADSDLREEERAKKLYEDCLLEYKDWKDKFPASDFDGKIAELEKDLAALGDDENLLDYVKSRCKDVFAQEAYAEIRTDLHALSDKYPVVSADVAVLLAKYAPVAADAPDMEKMHIAFRELENKRAELKNKIDAVKKQKLNFETNEGRLKVIKERGTTYHERLKAAQQKTAEIRALGSLQDLENKLRTAQREKQSLQEKLERETQRMHDFQSEEKTQKALYEKGFSEEQTLRDNVAAALQQTGFVSEQEARDLLSRVADEESAQAACKAFFEKYALIKNKCESTNAQKFADFDEEVLLLAANRKTQAGEIRDELNRKIAAGKTEHAQLEEKRKKYLAFEKELEEKKKKKDLCDELRQLMSRNKFMEFIASEYLQEICVRASKILLSLTSGRYFLRYADKEFKVGDNLDGGNLRAVKTLSGGETFLVSLSLALALSGEICDRSRRSVDFFFLDEGFGTLDENLLEVVMDVLTKLSKNFAIGLISHVEELKHRIDNKILVTAANERHGSQIKVVKF